MDSFRTRADGRMQFGDGAPKAKKPDPTVWNRQRSERPSIPPNPTHLTSPFFL